MTSVHHSHLDWPETIHLVAPSVFALAGLSFVIRAIFRGDNCEWPAHATSKLNICRKNSHASFDWRATISLKSMTKLICTIIYIFCPKQQVRRSICSILNRKHHSYSSIFAGNVSIGTAQGFHVPLYFQLPSVFHGDHIASYNGYLRYSIVTQGCQTVLHENVLRKFPLVRIYSHGSLVIEYFGVCDISFKII